MRIFIGIVLLCMVGAERVARLKLHLVSFVNPTGAGANGHCCDGKWGICQRNGCDHFFKICVDGSNSASLESCSYHSVTTSQIENQNTNNFGDKIGNTPNPVAISFNDVLPRQVTVKVGVWDKDNVGQNDHVDTLSKSLDPARAGSYSLTQRTTLQIRTEFECEPMFFDTRCPCKVRGNVASCNNGKASCKTGWIGSGCTQKAGCPQGWKLYDKHCYLFSTEQRLWDDARKRCQGFGGDLVEIDTWSEDRFIVDELRRTHSERGDRLVWIGLNDRNREANWVWNDGTPLRIRHWRHGEPNNDSGNEDCGAVYQRASWEWLGRWNDISCNNNRLHFICEKQG